MAHFRSAGAERIEVALLGMAIIDPTVRTLCIVQQGDRVLLGLKKRGFGAGKWNGFGGKVEQGESLEEAARRELREEAHITAVAVTPCGTLAFTFKNGHPPLMVHVFTVPEFTGTPAETEEMLPQWFLLSEIPYSKMWVDDPYWLPLVLRGSSVAGTFILQDEATLVSYEVKEVAL